MLELEFSSNVLNSCFDVFFFILLSLYFESFVVFQLWSSTVKRKMPTDCLQYCSLFEVWNKRKKVSFSICTSVVEIDLNKFDIEKIIFRWLREKWPQMKKIWSLAFNWRKILSQLFQKWPSYNFHKIQLSTKLDWNFELSLVPNFST